MEISFKIGGPEVDAQHQHLFELINKLVAVDGMHDLRPPPAHSGHLCHGYGLAELGIPNQCTVAVNDCKRVGNTP